jgi:hypothetical protein
MLDDMAAPGHKSRRGHGEGDAKKSRGSVLAPPYISACEAKHPEALKSGNYPQFCNS